MKTEKTYKIKYSIVAPYEFNYIDIKAYSKKDAIEKARAVYIPMLTGKKAIFAEVSERIK